MILLIWQHFQIKAIHHNSDITKGIEDFAIWLSEKNKDEKKPNDLEVMNKMSLEKKDIRFSPHLIECSKTKQGGEVIMGIDEATMWDIMTDKVYVGLYVMDKTQFDEIKNQQ